MNVVSAKTARDACLGLKVLNSKATTVLYIVQLCELFKIQSKAFHWSPAIPDVLFSNSVRHPGRRLSQRSRLHPDTNGFGHWLPAVSQDWRPTRHARVERSRGVLQVTVWTRRPLRDKPPIDHCLAVAALGSEVVFYFLPHLLPSLEAMPRRAAQICGYEIYDPEFRSSWHRPRVLHALKDWGARLQMLLPSTEFICCKRLRRTNKMCFWPRSQASALLTRRSTHLFTY